ncbi:MAG TPA: MBL fold metallo-hydrolase [Cyanothece sp. UBA12306]|nr:MBL fold metallo-hydrolase [Cyanothece sp. UBA12306]
MLARISTVMIATAMSILINVPLLAQARDFSQVKIKTIPVREQIYMLEGEGGNIGVFIGEDGVIMIDDQFAPLTGKIKAAIAKLSQQPIRFLINTHWHFDHTGGNENLGSDGVVILAHDNVRKRMSVDNFMEAFNRKIPASPDAALPIITFANGVTFHLNGDTLKAINPTPNGHTDGDTILHWEKANVIHTGDLFFNGFYPFIDTSHGGSLSGMIDGVNKILAITDQDTLIIPGHGALSNRQELIEYRDMLIAVQAKTKQAIADGASLETFLKSNPTAEFDQKWGQGFLSPEKFQTIIYQSVSQNK